MTKVATIKAKMKDKKHDFQKCGLNKTFLPNQHLQVDGGYQAKGTRYLLES
jgi:hypothetical protein